MGEPSTMLFFSSAENTKTIRTQQSKLAPDGPLEKNVTNPSERICHRAVELCLPQLVTACNHHFLITENNAFKGIQQTRAQAWN